MSYLFQVFTDEFDRKVGSSIDRITGIRLFFLCETAGSDWNTKQHEGFAIKPMRNIAYKFEDFLNSSSLIGQFDKMDITDHARFGVFVAAKGGHTQRIFDEQTSGCEVFIRLPIKKVSACSTC